MITSAGNDERYHPLDMIVDLPDGTSYFFDWEKLKTVHGGWVSELVHFLQWSRKDIRRKWEGILDFSFFFFSAEPTGTLAEEKEEDVPPFSWQAVAAFRLAWEMKVEIQKSIIIQLS